MSVFDHFEKLARTSDAQQRADERDAFEARLKQEYLPSVPESVSAKVFDYAWEEGHASGEHEVETVYSEVSLIALEAWEAGRKHEIDRG